MKLRENSIIQECLTACSHKGLLVLEPKNWHKTNPPPFHASDLGIKGVVWRANIGAARYGVNRFVRFGLRGQPDIEGMLRGGHRIGFECKQGDYTLSPYQIWYSEFFGGLGMALGVVRKYDDAFNLLTTWMGWYHA